MTWKLKLSLLFYFVCVAFLGYASLGWGMLIERYIGKAQYQEILEMWGDDPGAETCVYVIVSGSLGLLSMILVFGLAKILFKKKHEVTKLS